MRYYETCWVISGFDRHNTGSLYPFRGLRLQFSWAPAGVGQPCISLTHTRSRHRTAKVRPEEVGGLPRRDSNHGVRRPPPRRCLLLFAFAITNKASVVVELQRKHTSQHCADHGRLHYEQGLQDRDRASRRRSRNAAASQVLFLPMPRRVERAR